MSRVLFQVSGSIAAFKACTVVSELVKQGHEVQVVASPGALQFVGAATWEGLTSKPVFHNLWEEGRAMDHIALARWCDLALVCPASARTLNGLAAGTLDSPIGSLFLAYDLKTKPYWVYPAMNTSMWNHPSTQASLEKLSSWGVRIQAPGEGMLACGEEGQGRLQEPEAILQSLKEVLS